LTMLVKTRGLGSSHIAACRNVVKTQHSGAIRGRDRSGTIGAEAWGTLVTFVF
jgi:hypothetical protein